MKKYFLILFFDFLILNFAAAAATVNINTATLKELTVLAGIGDVKAQAIIDSRPYYSLDDLLKVNGIGEKTLAKIKEQGLACVNCQADEAMKGSATSENYEVVNNTNSNEIGLAGQTVSPQAQQKAILYPSGIFLNEILPSADGSDETGEWVEVYNSNNFEVDISGWKISDIAGAIKSYAIPEGAKIPAFEYAVFARPETKITLNNEGDGIDFLNPDGKEVDYVEFSRATKGQSYARFSNGWQWTTIPTKGTANTSSLKNNSKDLSKTEKSVNNEIGTIGASSDNNANHKKSLAALTGKTNPWFLFLTAVALTAISAIAVIFIKFRSRKSG